MNTAEKRAEKIPFDWRIVKVDDTRDCDEAWRKRMHLKSCATYYVYDANRHVHCCELTPSYELHAVATDSAFDIEEPGDALIEEVDEVLREAMHEQDVIYVHVGRLNCPEQKVTDDTEREEGESDEVFYNRVVNELREYYQGNCPCF